jgi:hypothetical protein
MKNSGRDHVLITKEKNGLLKSFLLLLDNGHRISKVVGTICDLIFPTLRTGKICIKNHLAFTEIHKK